MKATGMVRRIDELGRVVIPKEIRSTFGIAESDPLEIFVDGQRIVLQKYAPGCTFCQTIEDTKTVLGKLVCGNCAKGIEVRFRQVGEVSE